MWSAVYFFCLEAKLCFMSTTLFCILPPRTEGWLYPAKRQITSTKNLTLVTYFDLRTEALRLVLTEFVRWSNWCSGWLTEEPCFISRCCVNYHVHGSAVWDRRSRRALGAWLGQECTELGKERVLRMERSSLDLEIIKLLWLQLCAALLSLGDQSVGPKGAGLQSFELQLLKSGVRRYLEDCCVFSMISIK